MSDDIRLNTDGLKAVLSALKNNRAMARVGVIGDGVNRSNVNGGLNNASIGAIHELGGGNNPIRSFLRMPITDHLKKELDSIGALEPAVIQEVIKTKSLVPWLRLVGFAGEAVVAEAFASNGYGKWAPLKSATIARKKVSQILVETQQLRNSISSDVKGA